LKYRAQDEQRIVHDKGKAESVTDFISANAEKIEADFVVGIKKKKKHKERIELKKKLNINKQT